MEKKYTHYGAGYGKFYEHELLSRYIEELEKLTIIEPFESEEDVIETLELSLENGKTFYENAKPYMKREMEEYQKALESDDIFY